MVILAVVIGAVGSTWPTLVAVIVATAVWNGSFGGVPAVGFGFGDAGDEVVTDLFEAEPGGGVGTQQWATETAFSELRPAGRRGSAGDRSGEGEQHRRGGRGRVRHRVQYFEPTLDDDGTVGRLSFDETSDRTARQHLIDKHEADQGEDQQARTTAVEWLEEYLEGEGPDGNSADAKKSAAKAGISERTLQRARADLKVVWRRSGFGSISVTTWSLPSQIPANRSSNSEATNNGDDTATDDGDDAKPISSGTTGTTGITAGQQVMPSRATAEVGTTVAQLPDQHISPGVPLVPRTHKHVCHQCQRAAARSDTGMCDFCAAKHTASNRGDTPA